MPTGPPASAISPGVMPMLHLPGEITPGQFGPSNCVLGWLRLMALKNRASSWAGMPSVMQTMSGMPASAASRIAAGAPLGGTKMRLASAPVSATAVATSSKTGMPSTSEPPLPGVTPATTWVP